ncbi:MAG: hypothetical protein GW938_02760 [Leptospira sp.]|jgi:hypothetical protein|nr:hypothetical protein [Leptospira sp.]NCS93252.1 hypothetical protein [Leptospira sp.]
MQYIFSKFRNIFITIGLIVIVGNCITVIHQDYELNHNPKEVAKQVPKVKEILIYVDRFTELDEFSDKDLEEPLGNSRESDIFYNPRNQENMKRAIISEIVKCRCVETVRVLFKQADSLEEVRKENPNVILTKVRFFNNSGATFFTNFLSAVTLFLIPTWNKKYTSTDFEIYTPKNKSPEKMKFVYEETLIRHLFLLPWFFSDENKMQYLYSSFLPGSYRSAVEEGYKKKLFAIEK